MKKIAIIALLAQIAAPAVAQSSDEESPPIILVGTVSAVGNVTAIADIVAPLSITHLATELRFGTILGTNGRITYDQTGYRATNGVSIAPGSTPTFDRFVIRKEPFRSVRINPGTGTLNNTSGLGGPLSLNPTVVSENDQLDLLFIEVGGTMFIPSNQPPGTYRGTYTLTVLYQ